MTGIASVEVVVICKELLGSAVLVILTALLVTVGSAFVHCAFDVVALLRCCVVALLRCFHKKSLIFRVNKFNYNAKLRQKIDTNKFIEKKF
ncbi:MAG: hypothetical protein EAZ31_08715 [Cytophagia bacterium]|nr:MAG: hypothetical protein EAZ31_08715 [Cytophagia bacterium]